MKCSIVIPTWRRAHLLERTLLALEGQVSAGNPFEVVVVCDGYDEETRRLAARLRPPFPLDWVFIQENRGAGGARNAGVADATGELVLFLDDDTVPQESWLSSHVAAHQRTGDDRCIVMGWLENEYPSPPRSRTEIFLRQVMNEHHERVHAALRDQSGGSERKFWVGLNCSIRRGHFLAAGGFDPNLETVQEDHELGTRFRARGFRFVWEPRAVVRHVSARDLVEQNLQRANWFGASDVYRVRDKAQVEALLPVLAAMDSGPLRKRMLYRLAWHFPSIAIAAASVFRLATELTGARSFFRLWSLLSFAARYWRGVRAAGATRDDVRRFVATNLPSL
jgi:GT2 family glycosyltransferase